MFNSCGYGDGYVSIEFQPALSTLDAASSPEDLSWIVSVWVQEWLSHTCTLLGTPPRSLGQRDVDGGKLAWCPEGFFSMAVIAVGLTEPCEGCKVLIKGLRDSHAAVNLACWMSLSADTHLASRSSHSSSPAGSRAKCLCLLTHVGHGIGLAVWPSERHCQ